MLMENRVNALRDKHTQIKDLLDKEMSRSSWDEFRVARLKREKLLLKDEIHRLLRDAA